jgi:hypothetical protein
MSRSGSFFAGLLFWAMALAGGLTLAPCLILPAWIEQRAALASYAAAEQRLAALERRLAANDRKIEHHQNDVGYIEREARRQFGIVTPGLEAVYLDPGIHDAHGAAVREADASLAALRAARQAELWPEASQFIEAALNEYPLARIFVLEQTRPVVMGMGAMLLLTAVLALGPARRGRAAAPRAVAAEASA